MNRKPRILIVDDEPQIARVLRTGLTARGYECRVAADGISAMETFGDWPPDLIVTDLAMPNMDGLELCRKLRAISQIPIIVLSVRGEERTKVQALDAGADDYVTKPFGIDELLARVRAALRRAANSAAAEPSAPAILASGDFQIDLDSRRVTVQGREVHLTPKEYDLLVYFMRHAGKVLTQRTLLGAVWGGNYTEQAEYLRVFVGQLRKKIEVDPSTPRYILTEPWIGYRFNPGE
ncbi:MAG: response regulator transcription factor [Acidobacteriota bacterium]|nr:response regulator transcription factor [Acidobacteriota bacterium]